MNVWEGEKAKTFMNKNLSTKRVQKNDFRSNRVRKLNEDPRVIVGWVPKSIMFSNRVASSVKRNCDNEAPKIVTIVTMAKVLAIHSNILNLGL